MNPTVNTVIIITNKATGSVLLDVRYASGAKREYTGHTFEEALSQLSHLERFKDFQLIRRKEGTAKIGEWWARA